MRKFWAVKTVSTKENLSLYAKLNFECDTVTWGNKDLGTCIEGAQIGAGPADLGSEGTD